MDSGLGVLLITAASIGFVHTLIGPDHYLPFIMMSVSRKWSLLKTALITALCGVGHVASSVVLGAIGILLGTALQRLEFVEGFRGDLAAWGLTGFGLVYFAWGMQRAYKNKPHKHFHEHSDGHEHVHTHTHHEEHAHVHDEVKKASLAPWTLFIIFVLGPCEPLIPMLMYPAAKGSGLGVFWVATVFSLVTIGTMLSIVLIGSFGVSFLPLKKMERYTHALAGAAICLCGVAILCGL